MNDGGLPVFADPHGEPIPTGPDRRFRGNVVALTTRNRNEGLDINPKSPIPEWYGEPMDDAHAIDGMIQLE